MLNFFICVEAEKGKRKQYVGMYRESDAVKRITSHIPVFAGTSWELGDVTQFQSKGVLYGQMLRQSRKHERTKNQNQGSVRQNR